MKSNVIMGIAITIGVLGLFLGFVVVEKQGEVAMLIVWGAAAAVALSLAIFAAIVKHLEQLSRVADRMCMAMALPKTSEGACPRCEKMLFAGSVCPSCKQLIRVDSDE